MADETPKGRPTWLRLVHSENEPSTAREPRQLSLFLPGPFDCQMAVVRMPRIGEADFFLIFDQVQPGYDP